MNENLWELKLLGMDVDAQEVEDALEEIVYEALYEGSYDGIDWGDTGDTL
ncbi:MAG: hypothetical protein FWF59_04270 [Turicibacter sp.]|nr:hypothetical protein [Turicibacter sp.]